ncbi:MAG TPA: histidine phosphatase family protein [Pyrinomonadaceae bacterium]|nr:histidine phosphatase family protein [Pyrinomonadaceae bacterium]
MNLYLIRHAKPVQNGNDPSLSTTGQSQAAKLGSMFVRLGITPDTTSILSSNKKRAERTANIILKSLCLAQNLPPTAARPIRQLSSTVSLTSVFNTMRTVVADEHPMHLFVVWHFPMIGEVFKQLTNSNLPWPDAYGATAHLTISGQSVENGSGTFQWLVVPELLP